MHGGRGGRRGGDRGFSGGRGRGRGSGGKGFARPPSIPQALQREFADSEGSGKKGRAKFGKVLAIARKEKRRAARRARKERKYQHHFRLSAQGRRKLEEEEREESELVHSSSSTSDDELILPEKEPPDSGNGSVKFDTAQKSVKDITERSMYSHHAVKERHLNAMAAEDRLIASLEAKLRRSGGKQEENEEDPFLKGLGRKRDRPNRGDEEFDHFDSDEDKSWMRVKQKRSLQSNASYRAEDDEGSDSEGDPFADFNDHEESGEEMDDDKDDSEKDCDSEDSGGVEYDDGFEKGDNANVKTDKVYAASQNAQKYIPPALRRCYEEEKKRKKVQAEKEVVDNAEELDPQVLRRTRGLLNRVAEANVKAIASNLADLTGENGVRTMSSAISSFIISDCIDSTLGQRVLVPVHILHCQLGISFGGAFLSALGKAFQTAHSQTSSQIGNIEEEESTTEEAQRRACINLVELFSHLYLFKTIHCGLIFDLIRELLVSLSAADVEMLLSILRVGGKQLRSDDPSSIKDIIVAINEKAKALEKDISFGDRVQFMLQTINDLRTNRQRMINNSAVTDQLRRLASNASGKEGDGKRWWAIGASDLEEQRMSSSHDPNLLSASAELMKATRAMRMNTDVKKRIFIAIVTAEDYLDAFEKALSLRLSGTQQREIPRVIVQCVAQEKKFNPFYSHLACKLCEFDFNHKLSFQYALWDRFKVLEDSSPRTIANLSSFLAEMIANFALSLSALKSVEFLSLGVRGVLFFRLFFKRIFLLSEDTVQTLFQRLCSTEQAAELRTNIDLFLREAFLRARYGGDTTQERKQIRSKIRHVCTMLKNA